MNLSTFKASLTAPTPPSEASVYLQTLWHDAKGDWGKAHILIQDLPRSSPGVVTTPAGAVI
ncbi:hypothetical protein [Pontibacter sp. HSC-36F09]|uniref:hypothetical protein n=1 Tax=Pontibacter sp. HSC-36F09 TaxID=2910966 RepID=UPI0020A051D4|nr:hypothetical protein [Pontibacter sp. HSC-36F09]MCP2042181.1 uncharacterized protein YceK [Pontibacter sp. HSC-36F09]